MAYRLPEFIDTYSDDIIYLQEGRKALLTHPLMGTIKDLCDASFCRMFAVMMIGSMEAMLEEWEKCDKAGILKEYFAGHAKNGARVDSLYDACVKEGIAVDSRCSTTSWL